MASLNEIAVELPTKLGNMYWRSDCQYITPIIRDQQEIEPAESMVFQGLLAPGKHFLDVGAHVGWYSVLAGLIVGSSGKVFAVEPEPTNFQLLEANLRRHNFQGFSTCYQAAAWYTNQEGAFPHWSAYKINIIKNKSPYKKLRLIR
jgi:predicted methyltransferase